MATTREHSATFNLGLVKAATKVTHTPGPQVSVQGFVRDSAEHPCPVAEHLHVYVQANDPIIIMHVDLFDAAELGPEPLVRYRLDNELAAQHDMRAGDPFTEGLAFTVTIDRPMCAMIPTEVIPEDWRGRDLRVRCTDAAGNHHYSDPEDPFHIDRAVDDA